MIQDTLEKQFVDSTLRNVSLGSVHAPLYASPDSQSCLTSEASTVVLQRSGEWDSLITRGNVLAGECSAMEYLDPRIVEKFLHPDCRGLLTKVAI